MLMTFLFGRVLLDLVWLVVPSWNTCPAFFSSLNSPMTRMQRKKLKDVNSNNIKNSYNDINSRSVWHHSKWIVGKTLVPVLTYSSFARFMIPFMIALGIFVAQSFTIPILGKSIFQLELHVLLLFFLLMKCDRPCEWHSSELTQIIETLGSTNNSPSLDTTHPENQ